MIQVKHVTDGIYFDSKHYWKPVGTYMHGYCRITHVVHAHIKKPITQFEFLGHKSEVTQKPKRAVDYLSKEQRAKPVAPHIIENQAYEAVMGGS